MKISIIGVGRVGSAAAFSILHKCKIDEMMLIDVNEDIAKAEALDLQHGAVELNPGIKISGSSKVSEVKGSNIIVICAGRARKSEETREDLFEDNKKIVDGICKEIKKSAPESTVFVVTNPSTSLARYAHEQLGFPNGRVIAVDNQLDTARLKHLISEKTGLPVKDLNSQAYGGHGEEMQFAIHDVLDLSEEEVEEIKEKTKKAPLPIIKGKGGTWWGVATQIAKLVEEEIR